MKGWQFRAMNVSSDPSRAPSSVANRGPRTATSDSSRRRNAVLTGALFLTGFGLRMAVTSVGSVLGDIQGELKFDALTAGILTTLPVLSFAIMGVMAPGLARRIGVHKALICALLVSVFGFLTRAFAPNTEMLLLLSVVTLAGAAVANVLLPALVKTHFPDQVGAKTAVYVVALSLGTTASAGLTVPVSQIGDAGWRLGLAVWAVFPAVAILPWLATIRQDSRSTRTSTTTAANVTSRHLLRSTTVWCLAAFFSALSALAYIAFGWMAEFLRAHGISEGTAGAMVAVVAGVSIPVSMLIPRIPQTRHRTLISILVGAFAIALLGLTVAPTTGAWIWMALFGIGNALFSLSLAMIGLRSRTPETTAAVSAWVQGIGYLVAGAGPLLFGVMHSATAGWAAPLSLLWFLVAVTGVTGWFAARPTYVDDEVLARINRR